MESRNNLFWIVGIVLLACVSRIVKHPFNFTPVIAILLFSVALLPGRGLKFIFPMMAILLSDLAVNWINDYSFSKGTFYIYATYGLVLIAAFLIFKKLSWFRVIGASLTASIIFYLVSNFALLYPASAVNNPAIGAYRHDWSGILASYTAGLPFFRHMLIGDLFYCGLFFGAYFLVEKISSKILREI